MKQQARDRINMVMPGETGYWVFGSDLPAGQASGQPAQHQHKTRPICRGWTPSGSPSGARQQTRTTRGRMPRQWKNTRHLSRRNPASRQHMTSMSSAGSWDGRCATSSKSRPAASAATRWWRPLRPRLSNGTPFPTTFYLTHPVITSAVSRLEAAGLMNEMNDRLAADDGPGGRLPRRPRGLPRLPRRDRRPVRASAPSRKSTASPPAACRPASSACTSWWAIPWPPDPA